MNYKNLFLAVVLVGISCGVLVAQGSGTQAEKNNMIIAQDAAMQKAVGDGAAAFAKKDYAVAIDIYKKAISADPTHPAVPQLLKNIAAITLQRSVETFNAGSKAADDAMLNASKADLLDAEETSKRALASAKTNNYAPDKIVSITNLQKDVFQKISYIFFYIGTVSSDKPTLQISADASKAFLDLAAANEPKRIEVAEILTELKTTYNIVPK